MVTILAAGRLLGGKVRSSTSFTPLSLFSSSEPGAWYDPSDLTTLYQDAAGTTPVTAVEQPVGLRLDKSRGLVLGSELVTNGDFSNGTTGWTAQANATLSVEDGQLKVVSSATTNTGAWQAITTVAGKTYRATASLRGSAGTLNFGVYNGAFATLLAENSTYPETGVLTAGTIIFTATGTETRIIVNPGGTATTFYADNISVKELPGTHAFQTTDINRPVLSARYNLLSRTEEFDNAVWVKSNSTATTTTETTDPLGGSTAEKLTENTANSTHHAFQVLSSANYAAGSYTYSCAVKKGTRRYATVSFAQSGGNYSAATIDLDTGVITKSGVSGVTAPVAPVSSSLGGGWYRVTVTMTSSAILNSVAVSPGDSATPAYSSFGDVAYQGDGSFIYIWGADLRVSNDGVGLPAYQRVTTATDYDAGDQWPKYLRYNGTNSTMVTNAIDFSSTAAMSVFAGVRKLSDAVSLLFELSASSASNNGSFTAYTYSPTAGYGFTSKGTIGTDAAVITGYPAPITNLFTALGNIALPQNVLRLNGVQVAASTATQGTGNYGNYPLYLGARGGSSLWFNGRDYGLVVLGRTPTAAEITNVETWLNAKVKAYA